MCARQASVLLANGAILFALLGFCPSPPQHSSPWFMDHWPSSLCQSSRYISELLFNACLLSVLFAVINVFLYYGVLGGLNFTLDNSLKEEIKRRKRNFPARFLLA